MRNPLQTKDHQAKSGDRKHGVPGKYLQGLILGAQSTQRLRAAVISDRDKISCVTLFSSILHIKGALVPQSGACKAAEALRRDEARAKDQLQSNS